MVSENKHLLDLTKVLVNMLNQNDEQTLKVITERILVVKEKLAKDQKGFLESLVSNMEKEVREMNQIILTFVVNKLF